jgi:DnaJ-domain-containing protein 1
MRHTIADLEQLFDALKTDLKTLKALEEELQHRQTPRAVALLAKVRENLTTLKGPQSGSSPDTVPAPTTHPFEKDLKQQSNLWSAPLTRVPQIASKPIVTQQDVPRPAGQPRPPPVEASARVRVAPNGTHDTQEISIDEAYNILKATSCSTWETIEQTRRQVVQQSHPERLRTLGAEQRAKAKAEAKRANAAYAALRQLRTATSDDRPTIEINEEIKLVHCVY